MYRGYPSHWPAKAGGLLVAAPLGAALTSFLAPHLESFFPKMSSSKVTALTAALAYGALGLAAYKMSNSDSGGGDSQKQSLARGALWGAGLAGAVCAAAPFTVTQTTTAGLGSTMDKTFNMLTGKAAGKVAQKRAMKVAALKAATPLPR